MSNAPPSESVQNLLGTDWWVRDPNCIVTRGRLLRAFVPHVDQQPLRLVPTGRTEATKHDEADYLTEPLDIKKQRTVPRLPVAALPEFKGETRIVLRAKVRPVVVLSTGGAQVPRGLRAGGAMWQTGRCHLVGPFYGTEQDGSRGGWKPEFVERIRRAEYPQYIWDHLPNAANTLDSILRLDHIQPIYAERMAFELTEYRLSDEALLIIDQWIRWLLTDRLEKGSTLETIRTLLMEGASTSASGLDSLATGSES